MHQNQAANINADKTTFSSWGKIMDDWFLYRSYISKTAVVFIILGILLTWISFYVGAQILMFLPAFIVSLFLISLCEVLWQKKHLEILWSKQGNTIALSLIVEKYISGFFFQIIEKKKNGIHFVYPHQTMILSDIALDSNFRIVLQGRFDLVRQYRDIASIPETLQETSENTRKFEREDRYFHLRPYREGDVLERVDPLRSQMHHCVYIREVLQETIVDTTSQNTNIPIKITSNIPLNLRKNITHGVQLEWYSILLGLIGAFLEWRDIFFPSLALFLLFFAFWHQKKQFPLGSKRLMNLVALALFAFFIVEVALGLGTVRAGIHFLLLLAIVKHFFERERRDGFTYIFLILFVFVALSMLTLKAWFIVLFFLFILISMRLFSLYSGGELPDEYRQSFGFISKKFSLPILTTTVLCSMIVLFFLLPHGGDWKHNSRGLPENKEAKTGFSDEVSLSDIQGIKQDFSKAFVIENITENEKNIFQNLYWRGKRFVTFANNSWHAPEENFVTLIPHINASETSKKIKVKFYMEGKKNIFVPAAPLRVDNQRISMQHNDRTLLGFQQAQYQSQDIIFDFASDKKRFLDVGEKVIGISKQMDQNTIELMLPFWKKIPKEILSDPVKITDYIQNKAGFSYSLSDPAPNLASFLYEKKQGHCEYFASVLALTLQYFGYNATLVNGYLGGEWNDLANAWIVRGKDAHSWVEVWHQEMHWVRLDATPASSTLFWFDDIAFIGTVILYYDWAELIWYENIVQFTGARQKELYQWIFQNLLWISFFVFMSGLFIFMKKWYNTVIVPYRIRSEKSHFVHWLKKISGEEKFPLQIMEIHYPELVAHTRNILYSEHIVDTKILKALRNQWKNIFYEK